MGKSITDLSSVTTIGLDLAKHVFQVHGVDASGRVVVAKAVRRNKLLEFFASLPRCLVGLEACGSAHHWARELIKLGHDVRIMPPAYVKPYIRRQRQMCIRDRLHISRRHHARLMAKLDQLARPVMRRPGGLAPPGNVATKRKTPVACCA